ncbi:Alpha-monoglucosyldiacylglycerol synthase [Falsiruegeria litorea R37]|uniref:Alpha-monoglucosyldiacylglycerol synthase n=1 Tax=Falsiruegeria litorea R37 TaxID=1200284 RepID=A0A1Y5U1V0_9RHOB|nr:glycosyltransferase [Falsiruegeria litorea]SLN74460.1 Alpha-monoglucosyldiacylglycerol synthase [Falsiruegeria litorea R37]
MTISRNENQAPVADRPRMALVRRAVPQRLWANFEEAGRGIDLTVFETAIKPVEVESPETDAFQLLHHPAPSVADINRLLDEVQPQVVLCFGWGDLCSLASLTWAKARGCRTIVCSDSNRNDYARASHKEFAKAQILSAFDLAWAAGAQSAAYLEELGFAGEGIHVGALDTVDLAHFESNALAARSQGAALRSQMGLPERFFLCVARLSPEKNFERLLQAYARYHKMASPDRLWDLVVVGDGPLREALEAQSRTLGISEHVHFRGAAGYDDLGPYYGMAQAFVLASLKDTWAVVVNEAAAAHLPLLISTRAGSSEELVRDGENGFCFDPYDVGQLAARLAQLASGECDLANMGQRSREIVQGHGSEAYGQALTAMGKRAVTLPPRRFSPLARLACRMQLMQLK